MSVEIPSAILRRIMRSVDLAEPRETCGILRGRDRRITIADFAANVSPTPRTAFEIDPQALIAAYRAQRRAGAPRILGFFHTHPSGDPVPSPRDAASAAPDGMLWLIVTSRQARLWRAVAQGDVHGRFDPVRFDMRTGRAVEPDLLEARHVGHGRAYPVEIKESPLGY